MRSITNTIILLMAAAIIILIALNIRLQNRCNNRPPTVERDTVTVTITHRDTVYQQITKYYAVEKPVPVMVYDTIQIMGEYGVKQYHDTINHEYGKIYRWEWVKGDLLKKDLRLDLSLPTITETVTTTQTITNTVRSPLLFVTGGIRTAPTQVTDIGGGVSSRSADVRAVPTVGLFGVSEGHRWAAGVEWGLDRQLTMKIAYSIKR